MINNPEVQHAVNAYRLVTTALPSMRQAGDLLGRGAGSSLEFQEYREYTPGDDVRHLDWAAYARSDALMIRLHREEISPTLEVLLDGSRSMAVNPAKAAVAKQLAAALVLWTSRAGGTGFVEVVGFEDRGSRIEDRKGGAGASLRGDESWVMSDGNESSSTHHPSPITHHPFPAGSMRLSVEDLPQLEALPFNGIRPLNEAIAGGLLKSRRQAVRVVISDFLFDGDPEPVIRAASQSAGKLWVIQLLTRFEADPETLGGRRLVDVETGGEADVILNPPTIAEYKRRLASLQTLLTESCRRVHARFLVLIADEGLPALCRGELCAAGLLEPV